NRQGFSDPLGSHITERVRQHWMPVAVSPKNWQSDGAPLQFRNQCGNERPDLRVDRASPAEMVVVPGNLLQACLRNIAAAGDVPQERQDVFGTLRTSKSDDQDRIVGIPARGRAEAAGYILAAGA